MEVDSSLQTVLRNHINQSDLAIQAKRGANLSFKFLSSNFSREFFGIIKIRGFVSNASEIAIDNKQLTPWVRSEVTLDGLHYNYDNI